MHLFHTMNGSSNSSETCDLHLYSAITMATINTLFCVLGIIGNLLVYIAVYKTPDLQTLGNAYLVVLASADFLTSSIAQPLLIVIVIQETNNECDNIIITVFRVVGNFSCAASFFMLCAITLERFLAVIKPIAYKTFHPRRRFCIMTIISLILPLIYTVLRLTVSKKITSYASGALFVIGYVFIITSYIRILVQLRRQSKRMATSSTSNEDGTLRRQAEKIVTSTMAIVVVIFTIMWVPLFYYRLSKPSTNSGASYNWVRTTAISNSALNPIVYALRMKRFRAAFKQVLADGFQSVFSSRTRASSITTN